MARIVGRVRGNVKLSVISWMFIGSLSIDLSPFPRKTTLLELRRRREVACIAWGGVGDEAALRSGRTELRGKGGRS